jgi:hypothetical protein
MDVWSPDHQVDPLERIKRLDGEKGVSNNHTVASVEVKGNLRFPLDISYHGCPLFQFSSLSELPTPNYPFLPLGAKTP